MSLIVKSIKDKKIDKDLVLVGKSGKSHIYFSSKVPKNERVRELELDSDIDVVPFILKGAKQRSATMVAGLSGCGKSHKAVNLVKAIRELRGKNEEGKFKKVVMFSITADIDPAFSKVKNLAWVYFSHPEFPLIKLEDLKDCIIIFDDFTSIIDKKLELYVNGFITDCLERARKLRIDVICVLHQMQQFNKTKAIIYECDGYMLNLNTSKNAGLKFLKSYAEVSKEDLNHFKNLDSNNMFSFTYYYKSFPQYYISDNKIKLL